MKKGDFTNYVDEIKRRVEVGEITKEEAVYFVLAKVNSIFEHMKPEEQFMRDRMYESQNYN